MFNISVFLKRVDRGKIKICGDKCKQYLKKFAFNKNER